MDATATETPIHDVTDADFDERVLLRSHEVPVVVDFWAEWCGPCRALGPVLEREVLSLGGRVELAKVDTDGNPRVAAQYGIRSIPAVKVFRDGKVVDEFVGAQPAPVIRAFLERVAPSEARQRLERARAARAKGERGAAEVLAREVLELASAPDLVDAAALLLAELLLETNRPGELAPVLSRIDPRGEAVERADALREVGALLADAPAGGVDAARAAVQASPDDVAARYALGCALASRGDYEGALAEFLDVVTRSRKFKDDAGRRAMLAVFALLGDHDLAREYRRRLQVVT